MRKEYYKHFEAASRGEKSFIKLKDNAPEELGELIREIHFNHFGKCLPNDWIYKTIMEAFEELEENSLVDITIEADVYYTDLYKWLGEPFAHEFCNEAMEEAFCEKNEIYSIISAGQYLAKNVIYTSVNDFIHE